MSYLRPTFRRGGFTPSTRDTLGGIVSFVDCVIFFLVYRSHFIYKIKKLLKFSSHGKVRLIATSNVLSTRAKRGDDRVSVYGNGDRLFFPSLVG